MVETRLRLTGVGEGMTTVITTELCGADSPLKVRQALEQVFPEAPAQEPGPEPEFGSGTNQRWAYENVSLAQFLHLIHEQRILDTALDAMSLNLNNDTTEFSIARQAAIGGKISFPIPGEATLGGVIHVAIEGTGLADWLQAATWHKGRAQVPRQVNDEMAMNDDGEASTWV
jgi:predicted RNA binding protein with dsRBD fold (UPF0201 family)